MCDVYTYGNKPFEGDPRYVLKKVMADAAKMGYVFNTGPELEFFLFNLVDGKPTTQFVDQGCYFDLAPQDKAEDVRRDIVLALNSMGFEIEMSHHEVAASQHEIDFNYADAVTTADRVMTFKFATKAIALKYGLHASFMAKPLAGINGSGMHTHGSLAKNGKNAFYDANAPDGISDIALYYIGGLLKHAKAITGWQTRRSTHTSALSPVTRPPVTSHGAPPTGLPLSGCRPPVATAPVPSSAARTRCATRILPSHACSLPV